MKNPHNETTYSLLVRSEEKNRSVLEIVVFALFMLSAVFSIWQFAVQPISVPSYLGSESLACETQDGQIRLQC